MIYDLNPMGLAVYVHIPYCLQRCRYCDFTTFEVEQLMPPEKYLNFVLQEIDQRHQWVEPRKLNSIYFGGGTPSLFPAEHILSILDRLANVGFTRNDETEITIEINPATVDLNKLDLYIRSGINRFSVGAQTFNDDLLKLCGRRHTADDTRQTLQILKDRKLNYSFDLLFALPGQSLTGLKSDLKEALAFQPDHLSAYCLTVPEGHPMATGRAPEDEQLEMFDTIVSTLAQNGLNRYEISNFAVPGKESRHNLAYWSDRPYWGLGLSAHSYLPLSRWGTRFWNAKDFKLYEEQLGRIQDPSAQTVAQRFLPPNQYENLAAHEALSDFCHMFLRTASGLDLSALRKKFGARATELVEAASTKSMNRGLIEKTGPILRLTEPGKQLSNQVFFDLHFSADDWRE